MSRRGSAQPSSEVDVLKRCDYRDALIADLVDDQAALLERIALLEADVSIYREFAQQAVHAVHDATVHRHRLREQHQRLIDEFRTLRAQTMRGKAA